MSPNSRYCYPFGSAMKELSYAYVSEGDTSKYRYGFNNHEKDSELGEYYAFEYRIHDARLGRFLSVDPLAQDYTYYSPYQFAGNLPIWARDLEGLEPEITSSTQGNDKMLLLTIWKIKQRGTMVLLH